MFPDGKHICNHLCRVGLVGQTVPDRHSGILCQFLYNVLPITPVLDSIKHSSKYPRSVRYALFFPNLGTARVQISNMHSEIVCCHFERASGSRTCFFKNQSYVLSFKRFFHNALFLFFLQFF